MRLLERKNRLFGIFLLCLLIGLFLRLYNLGPWLRFTGDEARDALAAYEIARGINFPIEGPKIHIGFGFLGPAYYYLLALPLWLTGGNPAVAGWLTALFDLAAAMVLFFLTKKLFRPAVAWTATGLYLLSFQVIFYARWGWHPSLVPFFVLLMLYGCLQVADRDSRWAPATLLSFSIALQLHLTVIVLIVPIAIALWLGRKGITTFDLILGVAAASFPFLPLIQYEISNGYPNLQGAMALLSFQQSSTWEMPGPYLINSLSTISTLDIVHKSIELLPGGSWATLLNGLLFLFGLGLIIRDGVAPRYRMIMASWFVLPILALVAYSGFRPDYYLISWFAVPIIAAAYGLVWLWENHSLYYLTVGIGLLVASINLAAAVAYFGLMGSTNTVYSFYHGVPLEHKRELVEELGVSSADTPYDLTIVSWAWPNYQPYDYLLQLEPHQPQAMNLYESLDGERGPFILHTIPTHTGTTTASVPAEAHYLIKEPDTLPLPSEFSDAVKIGEFGGTGLYEIKTNR